MKPVYLQHVPYLPEYMMAPQQNLKFSGKYQHKTHFNFVFNYNVIPNMWDELGKKFSSYIHLNTANLETDS
jgi:hypothetical protein